MTVERRRSRRRDFQAVAIVADEGAAADVALDQTFGFEFGVSVGDGGAMNAQHCGEFAAGGNAVAGAKVTGVDEGTELVAKLDVQRDVAFGLKV